MIIVFFAWMILTFRVAFKGAYEPRDEELPEEKLEKAEPKEVLEDEAPEDKAPEDDNSPDDVVEAEDDQAGQTKQGWSSEDVAA